MTEILQCFLWDQMIRDYPETNSRLNILCEPTDANHHLCSLTMGCLQNAYGYITYEINNS